MNRMRPCIVTGWGDHPKHPNVPSKDVGGRHLHIIHPYSTIWIDSAFPMGVPSFNRLVDVPPLFVLMCYHRCLVETNVGQLTLCVII